MSEHASSRRAPVLVVVLVVLLVAAVTVTYVALRAGSGGTRDASRPAPSATPLDAVDLSGLPVQRASLCGRVQRDDVETALQGPVTVATSYDSGDRASLAPGVRDVAHEYDCTYRTDAGAEARLWVFAEPVTRGEATGLVRSARHAKKCRPIASGPAFGAPDAATSCRGRGDRAVTLAGLFGDAWLSCRVSAPTRDGAEAAQVRRAQRWCVDVATSVGARP